MSAPATPDPDDPDIVVGLALRWLRRVLLVAAGAAFACWAAAAIVYAITEGARAAVTESATITFAVAGLITTAWAVSALIALIRASTSERATASVTWMAANLRRLARMMPAFGLACVVLSAISSDPWWLGALTALLASAVVMQLAFVAQALHRSRPRPAQDTGEDPA